MRRVIACCVTQTRGRVVKVESCLNNAVTSYLSTLDMRHMFFLIDSDSLLPPLTTRWTFLTVYEFGSCRILVVILVLDFVSEGTCTIGILTLISLSLSLSLSLARSLPLSLSPFFFILRESADSLLTIAG